MKFGLLFPEEGVTATDRRRIIRGTFHSFLIQGFSIALVFLSNWWLVRSSDPDSYGLYIHVFNWVSILSVIVMGGRDDLVLAQLPKYLRGGRHRRLVGMVQRANSWVLLAALVVCGGFLALITVFPIRSLSENAGLFRYGLCAVYFAACLGLNQMILQAMNHIRLSQIVEKLLRPLLLILFTAVFHWSATGFDAAHLVVLGTLASGVCCGVILLLAFGKTGRYRDRAKEDLPRERLGRSTFYFFVISLMNLLAIKITMLILPLFTPVEDIGIFNIAYRFADLLIFPFFLMHTVLPQLFARHSRQEVDYTKSLFRESNRLMALLAAPLLVVNLVAGPFLLRLFGPAFGAGYHALVYISLAQLLFSLFGPTNTILMMQGRERSSAICLMVYVGLLALTSRLLIPVSGITGGALAILISSAGYNGLLAVIVYRQYGICSPFFSWMVGQR
jgi:O-antigen/teichoic acid export membrane protein